MARARAWDRFYATISAHSIDQKGFIRRNAGETPKSRVPPDYEIYRQNTAKPKQWRLFAGGEVFEGDGGGTTEAGEAAEERGAGELGRAVPVGYGEGVVGVYGTGTVRGVNQAQSCQYGSTYRGLFVERGPLPIDTEALAAKGALKILSFVRLSK